MITVEDMQKYIEKGLAEGSLKKDSWVYTNGYYGESPIAGLEVNKDNELVLIELC